ncbi:MAG: hypothetical protein M1812_002651 [Candelaria pacifica]|nr:MAG: hypothetical protein M1812_002651 [Candelaria pacifica]
MSFKQAGYISTPDDDKSTTDTIMTPSEDTIQNNQVPNPSLIPWPNSTFIIRSISSGHVLTLLGGRVVLTQPGNRGSIHWTCVESQGWLGFQNPVSGKYLGSDREGEICCSAEKHDGWEYFCARMRPEGGFYLLMMDQGALCSVGMTEEQSEKKLVMIRGGASHGIVWGFSKV